MVNIGSIRVGTTRTGKTIVYVPDRKHIDKLVKHYRDQHFSHDDLLDAFALYEFLALRAKRRLDSHNFFANHAEVVTLAI